MSWNQNVYSKDEVFEILWREHRSFLWAQERYLEVSLAEMTEALDNGEDLTPDPNFLERHTNIPEWDWW